MLKHESSQMPPHCDLPGCYHNLPLPEAVRRAFFYLLSQGEAPTVRGVHKHTLGSFRDVSQHLRQVKEGVRYQEWER